MVSVDFLGEGLGIGYGVYIYVYYDVITHGSVSWLAEGLHD